MIYRLLLHGQRRQSREPLENLKGMQMNNILSAYELQFQIMECLTRAASNIDKIVSHNSAHWQGKSWPFPSYASLPNKQNIKSMLSAQKYSKCVNGEHLASTSRFYLCAVDRIWKWPINIFFFSLPLPLQSLKENTTTQIQELSKVWKFFPRIPGISRIFKDCGNPVLRLLFDASSGNLVCVISKIGRKSFKL